MPGVGTDLNSDPLFTNAAADDFTLQPTSPCINQGEDLGDTYDDALHRDSSWPDNVITADQDDYGAGWEIGAYVFTPIVYTYDTVGITEDVTAEVGALPPLEISVSDDVAVGLGSELITIAADRDFSSGQNNWTVVAGDDVTWDNVDMDFDCNEWNWVELAVTLTPGVKYRLQFDISAYTSGSLSYCIGDSAGYPVPSPAVGTFYFDLVAVDENYIRFGSVDLIGSIDNVSVKECLEYVTVSIAAPRIDVYDDVGIDENVKLELVSVISIYDDIGVLEDITIELSTTVIDVFESISVQEDVTVEVEAPSLLEVDKFDSIGITESVEGKISGVLLEVFDSITVEDIPTVEIGAEPVLSINVYDIVTVEENISVAIHELQTLIFDSTGITENIEALTSGLFIDVNDNISLEEYVDTTISALADLDVSEFDTISVQEDVTLVVGTVLLNTFDAITVDESISAQGSDLQFDIFDSVGVAEDITAEVVAADTLSINEFETVTVEENVTASASGLILSVYDTVTLVESTEAVTSINLSINDTVGITDEVYISIALLINEVDNVTLSEDTTLIVSTILLSTFDTINIAESIEAELPDLRYSFPKYIFRREAENTIYRRTVENTVFARPTENTIFRGVKKVIIWQLEK